MTSPREPVTSARRAFATSIGGVRGVIDSSLATTAFVVAYVAAGLTIALWVAVGVGVGLLALRLVRREPVQQAVSGFIGVAVAAFVAHQLGRATGFFLPGIVLDMVYGTVMLVSVAVRRPVVGYVAALLESGGADQSDTKAEDASEGGGGAREGAGGGAREESATGAADGAVGGAHDQTGRDTAGPRGGGRAGHWRDNPALRRAYTWATLVWAAVFWVRVAVQGPFYLSGEPLSLGIAKLALGWPLTALALAVTVVLVRRVHAGRKEADPTPAAEGRASLLGGEQGA